MPVVGLSKRKQDLTPRQCEVLALSARRRSAKQIAADLGISEGRVNQHISAIKLRLGVYDLVGLHDAHERLGDPYKETAGHKSQLPGNPIDRQEGSGVSLDQMSLSDAMPLRMSAPWETDSYRVGPGAFDGPGANLLLAASVIAISLGLPALFVLGFTARSVITAAFSAAP